MVVDLRALAVPPGAVFLYGNSRPLMLKLLYGTCAAIDPEFRWLEIRDSSNRNEAGSPVAEGWLEPSRLFLTKVEEVRPQSAVSNLALWTVIRSDEPARTVAGLADFLRLPPAVQEAVGEMGVAGRPRVLAIANSDRARPYYPASAEGIRPVLDAILQTGVSPVFGALGPPGPGRLGFEHTFEIRARTGAGWDEAELWCERARPGSPFRAGQHYPVRDLESLAAALSAHR